MNARSLAFILVCKGWWIMMMSPCQYEKHYDSLFPKNNSGEFGKIILNEMEIFRVKWKRKIWDYRIKMEDKKLRKVSLKNMN